MRFLIINSNRHRSPWPVPPVGACAVASAAAAAGHEVKFLDLCFARRPEKAVARAAREFRPDLVGVSIRNFDNCDWAAPAGFLDEIRDRIVRPIRAATPARLVLGGGAAGLMPAEFLDYFGADFVLRGDGEPAIVGLLAALESGTSPAGVPGIAYRDGNAVHVNQPARAPDLDALPLPYPERWLDLARYARWGGPLGIQTKRGCALGCTYCAYNEIEGRCYRLKSMDRIAREIAEALRGGAREIEFVDSTFNIPLDHALAVCRMLAERKFPARFSTMGINPLGAQPRNSSAGWRPPGSPKSRSPPRRAARGCLSRCKRGYTVEDLERTAALARGLAAAGHVVLPLRRPGRDRGDRPRDLRVHRRAVSRPEHLVLLVSGIRIVAGSPLAKQYSAAGVRGDRSATSPNLLQPVFYEPPIGRARLFEMIESRLRERPNHMALEDVEVPPLLLRGASALHRLFGSDKPMWRLVSPVRRASRALTCRRTGWQGWAGSRPPTGEGYSIGLRGLLAAWANQMPGLPAPGTELFIFFGMR